MAICTSNCNDCGFVMINQYLDKCSKCGSTNVDREHDVDLDDASHFADYVEVDEREELFDEDDTRCGPER